jgi:hypothetical protein
LPPVASLGEPDRLPVEVVWVFAPEPDEVFDPALALPDDALLPLVVAFMFSPVSPPRPPLPAVVKLLFLLDEFADVEPPSVDDVAEELPPSRVEVTECCGAELGVFTTDACATDWARTQHPAAPTTTVAVLIFQLDMVIAPLFIAEVAARHPTGCGRSVGPRRCNWRLARVMRADQSAQRAD